MYQLDQSFIHVWESEQGYWRPAAFSLNCPTCGRFMSPRITHVTFDTPRKTFAMSSNCVSCQAVISAWAIEPGTANDPDNKKCQAFCVYPSPITRQPIPAISSVPLRIQRAYLETLNVYNNGAWSATAICCRRTLEGIIGALAPKAKRNETLDMQLKRLSEKVDLAKPLLTLSNSLRLSGNLGAHFDSDRDPDQSLVEAMLDLLEYLLEYVYTLPAMIDQLNTRLEERDEDGD